MLKDLWSNTVSRLNSAGDFFAALPLRLILAWEFWESGMAKIGGENWFSRIQEKFPFPFSSISADLNWTLAAYGEVAVAILLLLGLFTRFAAISLIVITAVATAAVHWPAEWGSVAELWQGYAISDDGHGNFKLPLLFIIIALPLVFNGGGKLSLDFLLNKFVIHNGLEKKCDLASIGAALLVFSIVFIFLMPILGISLGILGLGLVGYQLLTRKPV